MKVIWLGDDDALETKAYGVTFEPGVEVDVSSLPEWQQSKLAANPAFKVVSAIAAPAGKGRRKPAEPIEVVEDPQPDPEPEESLSDDEN